MPPNRVYGRSFGAHNARVLMFVVSGQADGTSLCSDSPEELPRQLDDSVRDELYTLRLRT